MAAKRSPMPAKRPGGPGPQPFPPYKGQAGYKCPSCKKMPCACKKGK